MFFCPICNIEFDDICPNCECDHYWVTVELSGPERMAQRIFHLGMPTEYDLCRNCGRKTESRVE